jgi:hypothetical protein
MHHELQDISSGFEILGGPLGLDLGFVVIGLIGLAAGCLWLSFCKTVHVMADSEGDR